MTNLAPSPARVARGAFLRDKLKAERWSIRQAALAIGMSHSALAARVNAETAFTAEDIESIARLLKVSPVELYGEYLECTPRDLNPEPTDYRSARGTRGSNRPRNRAGRTSPKGRAA